MEYIRSSNLSDRRTADAVPRAAAPGTMVARWPGGGVAAGGGAAAGPPSNPPRVQGRKGVAYYCNCLKAERSVIVIAIIEVIDFIAIQVIDDCIGLTQIDSGSR